MKLKRTLLLFILCFLLAGCSAADIPPETTAGRIADTELNVASICLADLMTQDSYILLSGQGETSSIYRIWYDSPAPMKFTANIEFYVTEKLSADFLEGSSVTVLSVHSNSINPYDFRMFDARFRSLVASQKTVGQNQMLREWNSASVACLISGSDRQFLDLNTITCGTTDKGDGDDMGLLYLMRLYYDIRGTDTQYFGAERS